MIARTILGAAAVSLVAIASAANAATTPVNYAKIVKATEAAVVKYKSQVAACGSNATCLKAADKTLKSAEYRIKTASANPALTKAVQSATAKALTKILNTSLTCAPANAAACAKQNTKTLGSLTYRITNQPPISPV